MTAFLRVVEPRRCPMCQEPSTDIRRYVRPTLVFLFVFFGSGNNVSVCCGSCLARLRLRDHLFALFSANILLPLWAILYWSHWGGEELALEELRALTVAASDPPPVWTEEKKASPAVRAAVTLVVLAVVAGLMILAIKMLG